MPRHARCWADGIAVASGSAALPHTQTIQRRWKADDPV